MVERSNIDGSMRKSSSGCPVQHTQEKPSSDVANGQPSSAQRGTGRGVWSGVAAWLPFRGGGGGGGSVAGDVTSSTGGGSGAVMAPVQGTDLEKKEQGGCPVNSSERGGGDAPASSGCPVQHDSAPTSGSQGLGSIWGYLTGGGGGGGGGGSDGDVPDASTSSPAAAPAGAAPPKYNALNNEYVYGNEVTPGQEMPLSTSRQRSSIPKAGFNPDHQPQVIEGWARPTCVYHHQFGRV